MKYGLRKVLFPLFICAFHVPILMDGVSILSNPLDTECVLQIICKITFYSI